MRIIFLILMSFVGAWSQSGGELSTSASNLYREGKDPNSLKTISQEYVVTDDYIVGPGDYIEISADANSYVVQVSPEGYISINQIGGVYANGKQLRQVKNEIIEKLSEKYLRERCFVQLIRMRTQSIGILGEVLSPGYKALPAGIHLSQALRHGGKQKPMANMEAIQVIHRSGDTTVVNLLEIAREGLFEEDIELKFGDRIFVPRVDFSQDVIYTLINGNAYPRLWREGKTIYKYLDEAGFLDNPANMKGVYWANKDGKRTIDVDQALREVLAPGDTVDIIQSTGVIYVGGVVNQSQSLPYDPNMRPIEYVYKSGTNVFADRIDDLKVIRADGRRVNMDPINGKLFPGDYIELDMSNLDYAVRWTPIVSSALSIITFAWSIYLVTVWAPAHD